MPMDKGSKEAAILVFAMPKKPGKGVTPPTEALKKKAGPLPEMSDSEDEYSDKPQMCEECEGEGCEECDQKGYVEEDSGDYEAGAEDSHKKHMKIISKLVEMLDKE
jgi:hypothetical protein